MNKETQSNSTIQQLIDQHYVRIDFPFSHDEGQRAIDAFFAFLDLPDNLRTHIDFSLSEHHRRGDVGFKSRSSDDHIYNDTKEFFHYHPAILERYKDFLKNQPVITDFLQHADRIWKLVYDTTYNTLSIFEKDNPGTLSKIFDSDAPHILVRFLKYSWAESGKYLAKPHFDAGSFTLAIEESCPGLRIGSCPENLSQIDHRENEALFMFSSNYQKIVDTPSIAPGWHDVIQVDDSKVGKPYARWAIVAFIDGHDVEALSRKETHKWTVASM